MGTRAPENKLATLTEAEYVCELAAKAARDVQQLMEEPKETWNPPSLCDENVFIYQRKSPIHPDAKEGMLMLETELEISPEKLEDILAPWKDVRLRWDDMLEDASVIASFPNDVYLIRHNIKKMIPLSQSFDVVKKVVRPDGKIVFASCGTSHESYPPSKAHVYVGGYVIEKLPNERSSFTIIFHADLNLPGPKMISSLADRFKPRLMRNFVTGLRNVIEKRRRQALL